jgi:arylsulfatase A-like enzyme
MRFVAFLPFLVIFCCHTPGFSQKIKARPNIILIYADDLGIGEIGVYGQTRIKTPFLDKMSNDGMRFTQFYTSSPVCAPARCMLLTGRHGGHSYIRGNYEMGGFEDNQEGGQMPMPEGTFTIAHMLKKAGYFTGAIGKWGLGVYGTTGSPDKQGFDYFYGYLDQKQAHNHYPTHLWENGKWDSLHNVPFSVHRKLNPDVNQPDSFLHFTGSTYAPEKMMGKTTDFIRQHNDEPFFLYLPYTLPHLSLQAPASSVGEYSSQWKEEPYHGEFGYTPVMHPRATYAAMIGYLDKMVGNVFRILKDQGLDKNTLVMFSSDNGATFNVGGIDTVFFKSNGGLRGFKMDLYEGGIRSPLIAWWPGRIPAGKIQDHIAVQFDMMATLADIIGIDPPFNDGLSFLPALMGKEKSIPNRNYLYFEYPEKGGQVAIRMGKWKGIKIEMKKNKQAGWEIYDLETDPGEKKNIAALHPQIIQQFDAILFKEHGRSHIREWEFVDPKTE